jgi:hypothetical protein
MSQVTVDNGTGTDYDVDTLDRGSGLMAQVVALAGIEASFGPGYGADDIASVLDVRVDPDGHLKTRGAVYTDEGTLRVNFANSSLAVSIGTCTFTNASLIVTGTGFAAVDAPIRPGDYVKRDADAESAWAQIQSIDSDTSLTLVAAYTGTGGTGASSRVIVKPSTGTGGTIAVASGVATITAGTTAAVTHTLGRKVDYAPLVFQTGLTLSQRIANQTIYAGCWHENATPRWFARFQFTGTTNTTVICESGRNPSGAPSANEIETTTVTIPAAATTATERRFRTELLVDKVRFYIDGLLVAEHYKSMPSPYDEMFCGVQCVNGTTPASGTTITVNYMTAINVNKLTMAVLSEVENIVASQPPATDTAYSVAGVIAINTVLVQLDCAQLRGVSIQCTAMGTTGVVTPEWSNDATNWQAATILTQAGATAATFNAAGLWTTPVLARHFRLRLSTATTAGTTTLRLAGFAVPIGPQVSQPVAGTLAVSSISTSVVPGTAATNLGKARDSAIGATDTGVAILGVRRDAPTAETPVAGDYVVPQVSQQGAQYVHPTFSGSAGATPTQIIGAATTNATSVKASAGVLTALAAVNNSASWRYLKFHNVSAAPTPGSGVVQTYGIPPGGGITLNFPSGKGFSTGIGVTITGGIAAADTTAIGANEVAVSLDFH